MDFIKQEIYFDIAKYIKSNTSKTVNNLFECLKLHVCSEPIAPDTKNLHLLNGTFNLETKTFSNEKQWCTNRLGISYNPNAKKPVKFLKYVNYPRLRFAKRRGLPAS